MPHRWTGSLGKTALTALLAAGVSCSDDTACGPGTTLEGDTCVAEGAGGAGGAGSSVGGAGGLAAGGQSPSGGAPAGGGGEGGGGPIDPGYPDFPDVVGHLTVAIRTGAGTFDGTDANSLSFCLTADDCFALNVADVNDFRQGEMDVYHFTGVGLPREEIDRVELRSANGTDAWRPVCLSVQLDGEPVYCEDGLDVLMGQEAGELQSFIDPEGLHLACSSCYPDLLSHGPLVGAVTDEAARLSIRTDATRRVVVSVLDESQPGEAEVAAYVYPSPETDYATTIDLGGLAPERSYRVLFEVDGELSAREAELKTAPSAGSATQLTFGFGTCSRNDDQPIFGEIGALEPDLFVFGGDNHYGNTADLESLWWNYRWALDRPERGALLSKTPTLATWDDHDFVGNNTNGTSPGKDTALLAFSQYWGNLSYGTASTPGVFSRVSYGDVDFFLLDSRYHRSPDGTANGSILGPGQTDWLKAELLASTATFKLLVSGTIWSNTGDESWLDFPAARADVFDFIRDNDVGGVVLLSGDVHRSSLRRIRREAAGGYDLPEIISSPLANTNSACSDNTEPDAQQLSCFDAGRYFALFDLDTTLADPELSVRLIDEGGQEVGSLLVHRSELE
ncbi:MAG: alkaline phosphatase family protein [Polyangiaceae bacterium]|jgi:alkaline phosphatase D|nr:alkaline phosphatase family protein [Polyangiaceae bacterium]MBK8938121.1 alkaline phosphatase family protein [Polyangiaceae bacterium]